MKVIIILFMTVVLPIWIVFHFIFSSRGQKHQRNSKRRSQQLEASKAQFKRMEDSLRAMEKYVTSPTYQLNKEIKDL